MTQDKCPDCKGWGYDRRAMDKAPCEACNGTGEKKLDSPDRERLAKMICFWHIGISDMWDRGENTIGWQGPPKKDYYEIADQIIALIEPLIKDARKRSDKRAKFIARQVIKIYEKRITEAKKQGENRIIRWVEDTDILTMLAPRQRKSWQALKEGE